MILSVLRSALAETSLEERLDDPYLEALTREVRGGEARDDVYDFARAFLLRAERTRPRPPTPVPDWRGAIWALLGHPPPPVRLLVDVGRRWILTADARRRVRTHHVDDLGLAPPIGPLLVGRADRLWEVGVPGDERTVSAEPWTTALAAWKERREQRNGFVDARPSPTDAAVHGRVLFDPDDAAQRFDWAALDRTLSGIWRGLRHAAGARATVELAGGRRLVPLGGGVCAEIAICRGPSSDCHGPVRAAFRTYASRDGVADVFPAPSELGEGWIGSGIGGRLPRGVWIRGAGVVLDVKLVQALWL